MSLRYLLRYVCSRGCICIISALLASPLLFSRSKSRCPIYIYIYTYISFVSFVVTDSIPRQFSYAEQQKKNSLPDYRYSGEEKWIFGRGEETGKIPASMLFASCLEPRYSFYLAGIPNLSLSLSLYISVYPRLLLSLSSLARDFSRRLKFMLARTRTYWLRIAFRLSRDARFAPSYAHAPFFSALSLPPCTSGRNRTGYIGGKR